jgi:hypothetical protein
MRIKIKGLLITVLFVSFTLAAGENKPVIAVLDFSASVLSTRESGAMIDHINQILSETNRFYVIGRRDRNRFLREFDFPESYAADENTYADVGRKLYADYVIGGRIERDEKGYTVFAALYHVPTATRINSVNRTFTSLPEMRSDFRGLFLLLIDNIKKSISVDTPGERLLNSLSPVTVREKILFILRKNCPDANLAACKDIVNRVMRNMAENKRFVPYFTENDYDVSAKNEDLARRLLSERDCHYAVILQKGDAAFSLSVTGEGAGIIMTLPIDVKNDRDKEADTLTREMEQIPLLSEDIIAREIDNNIVFEEKLEDLLFSERLLSLPYSISIYTILFKSTDLYMYLPTFNMLSIEGDFSWYYSPSIGVSIGYGFSMGYPGFFDRHLDSHPPVFQHELRIAPLIFRTGGELSFLGSLAVSCNMHNACYMTTNIDQSVTCTDEKTVYFVKIGVNAGLAWNFNSSFSLYWKGIIFNMALPFGDQQVYPDHSDKLFSIDVGSVGIIYRF